MRSSIYRRAISTIQAIGLLSMFALVPAAMGQAVYGSIFGTITDNTGAVVPNATITVTDVAKGTSVTTQSGGDGEYRVQHLIPDTSLVDADASGFTNPTGDSFVG